MTAKSRNMSKSPSMYCKLEQKRCMQKLVDDGLCRNIGVSNFTIKVRTSTSQDVKSSLKIYQVPNGPSS